MMEITKFFDKKKRDLSSKSNDGDDSRGPRESSLDDAIANATNTDVFIESLKSEDCAAIHYSCIKKLEKETKKVLQMCEKTKESQIKVESQLNSLSEAMDFMRPTSLMNMNENDRRRIKL